MKPRFLLENVSIEFSDYLPEVAPISYKESYLQANDRQFYLQVKDVGEFYCENGTKILIKPILNVDKASIELYLNGSVLGAILQQKKILALHASSFVVNDQVIILCGESGFGKSSIALSFCIHRNGILLTDDITPIQNGNILPIAEKMKLWGDSLASMDIDKSNLHPVHEKMDKYYFDVITGEEPRKPDMIIFGEIDDGLEESTIHEVHGALKFELLYKNQYWEELSSLSPDLKKFFFELIAEVCDTTKMYSLSRSSENSIDETTSFIIEQLLTNK